MMKDKDGILFVAGPGRSGTTLLRDLLDGHPRLVVWPYEWQYLSLYGKYVSTDLKRFLPAAEIISRFLAEERFKMIFRGPLVERRVEGRVSEPDWVLHLRKGLERVEEKEFSAFSFFRSMASLARGEKKKYFVCKCNDPLRILEYTIAFPEARFLFILRNPIDCFLSKLQYRARSYDCLAPPEFPRGLAAYSLDEIEAFFKALAFLRDTDTTGERYNVLRLEDLVQTPGNVLQAMGERLSLSWDDNLIRPSWMGLPVRGHFSDPRRDERCLAVPTEARRWGLTKAEKKRLRENKDIYSRDYPELEKDLESVPNARIFRRAYRLHCRFHIRANEGREFRKAFFRRARRRYAELEA
ncbi:MAG: sulfotransferase [Candidatus Hydrogenedentota bacterium]|nr:MAG: sulfotransferase [Candidatus Hydrogenedentota bacterium]